MKLRRIAILFIALAAFAAGWMLGNHKASLKPKFTQVPASIKTPARLQSKGWNLHGSLADILKNYTGGARIAALAKLIAEMPVSELPHLLDEAAHCPDASFRQVAENLAYAKWVSVDSSAALGYANIVAMRSGKPEALDYVFSAWSGLDPRAALNAAMKLNLASFRATEINLVLATWVQGKNPQDALAAIDTIPSGTAPGMTSGDLMRSLFDQWSQIDPMAALAALGQMSDVVRRNALENVVIRNLADSDPQAAFDALRKIGENQATIALIFQKWGAQDPSAAYLALQQLPIGGARSKALQSVFNGWAESDPIAALQAAQALPAGRDRTAAETASLNGLASQNPQSAADFISGMPQGSSRNGLISSLAQKWSESDPVAALTWLKANASGATYDTAVGSVLTQMSKSDPVDALAFIGQLPDDNNRNDYIKNAIGNWASQDPTAAMNWVQNNLNGSSQDLAMASVASQLAISNPTMAMGIVGQLPNSPARNSAITTLASHLSSVDVNTATQWLQSLPDDMPAATQRTAYQNYLSGLVNVDPAAAAAYAQTLADDSNLSPVITRVASQWAQDDGVAALKWSESLPAGTARDGAISAAVTNWANVDALSAWNYTQNLPPGDDTNKLLLSVAANWSKTDPEAAASAVAMVTNTNDETDFAAAQTVASNWATQDTNNAAQWALGLPNGATRDYALAGIVTATAAKNPQSAFNYALNISTPEIRLAAAAQVELSWQKKDPVAAEEALQSAGFSSSDIQIMKDLPQTLKLFNIKTK